MGEDWRGIGEPLVIPEKVQFNKIAWKWLSVHACSPYFVYFENWGIKAFCVALPILLHWYDTDERHCLQIVMWRVMQLNYYTNLFICESMSVYVSVKESLNEM